MPYTDTKTGRRLSGHAQRLEAERARKHRLASEAAGGEDFDVLGAVDLEHPETGLAYVRKAQLIAFQQICQERDLPKLERWKLIREFSAVIGITHPRATLEDRASKLERGSKKARRVGASRVEAASSVRKPPTARGAPRQAAEPEEMTPLNPDVPEAT